MASAADPTAQVGLLPLPPGVVADFNRTTDVQIAFMVVFGVSFGFATIALLLRVYTRAIVVKSIGFDERMLRFVRLFHMPSVRVLTFLQHCLSAHGR
jgi:hypothetical protein